MRRGFKFQIISVLLIFIFASFLMSSIGCKITSNQKGSFLDKATSLTRATSKTLTTKTSLKGRVIDAYDGKGVNNLTVTTEGNLITKTINDGVNDGVFYFENIPADKTKDISFVISVSGSGFETTYRTITIKSSDYGKLVDTTLSENGGPIKIYRTSYEQKGYVIGRVLNENGQALNGVTVETEELDISTGQPYITHTTSTGMPKSGMFKLELPAAPPDNKATYTIIVKATGYDYYTIKDVEVVRLETKDLGELKLSEATESVETRTITGQIVDGDTGYGVDGAVVSTEGGISVTSGNTSPKIHQGDFVIKNAPLGTYYIFVSKNGYVDYSKQITVTSGTDPLDIGKIQLSKGPAETVYGKVYDSESFEGINDITVEIRNYDSTFYKYTSTNRINGTDGLYRFDNNIPIDDNHQYIVTAKSDDYVPKSKLVSVNSNDTETKNAVDIPLVKIDHNSPVVYGYVYDKDNVTQPIALATVEIFKSDGAGGYETTPVSDSETDADGYYVVQGLSAGNSPFKIVITKSGYKQGYKEDINVSSSTSEVQVPPIFLEKLSGTIYGTVYISDNDSDDGTDYDGGLTSVISDAKITLINRLTGQTWETVSRLDGSYVFQNVEEGNYIVAGEKAGAYDLHFYQVSITPTSYSIKQDIELSKTTGNADDGFLVGAVVSSVDKKPIESAIVKIVGSGTGVGEDTTDLAGRFRISYNPGTYVVSATAINYSLSYKDSVTLDSGKVTSITFELEPLVGKIQGVISSAKGGILGGATVELLNLTDETKIAEPIFSDYNNGSYYFKDVPYGNYRLRVSAQNYYTKTQNITLSSKVLTVNVTLSPMVGGIDGHVYYDTNANGVYEAGEGLEGIKLSLYKLNSYEKAYNYDVYTDTQGLYSLSGITAAITYRLVASSDGYKTMTREVTVLAGQTVPVNFALQKTGSKIYGLVYDDINNNGSCDDGEGLTGASVELWKDGTRIAFFATLTGGSFEFNAIESGQYILKAGYATSTITYSDASYLIEVGDVPYRKDIVLSPLFGQVKGWAWNDVNRDGLTSAAESYLSGVTVTYTDTNGSYFITYTDNNGRYIFNNVSKGSKTFKADAGDYYQEISKNLTVNAGETYELNFPFILNLGNIHGYVKDGISGNILQGASVTLFDIGGVTIEGTLTNSDGEFWITGITAGNYKLIFQKENYYENYKNITVTAGSDLEIGTINLQPQLGGISGEVRDAVDSSLLVGATIGVKPLDTVTAGFSYKELTATNGKFELYNLKEGYYRIGAHKYPLYSDLTKEVEVKRSQVELISLALYPLTGGISVEVVDKRTNQRISSAKLSSEAGTVYSDVNGLATILGLKEGQQKIEVSKSPYYQTHSFYVDIKAGSVKGPYTFALEPSFGGITGEVYDLLTDQPILGASISVYWNSGSGYQYVKTVYSNNEGVFELTGISEGTNKLVLFKDNYLTQEVLVTVTAGKSVYVGKITLKSVYGDISGTITDKTTSQPIENAVVKIKEYPTKTTSTDVLGKFSLTGITAGDVTLLISATPEYASDVPFLISVPAGDTATISLELTKVLGEITGEVRDGYTGALLAGVGISVEKISPQNFVIGDYFTNTHGYYRITGLSAGVFKITASYDGYLSHEISVALETGEVSTGNLIYIYQNKGTEISGEVVDADDLSKLAGVTVSVKDYPGVQTTTDGQGIFYFRDLTPEVLVTLKFEKEKYNSTSLVVTPLKGGEKRNVGTINMKKLGSVSGSVTRTDSSPVEPLEGITVSCNGISVKTNYNGSYTITGITFGTHYVVADGRPKYNRAQVSFSIDPTTPDATGIAIELKKELLGISGEVVDASTGEKIAGATISINGLTSEADENGFFQLSGITVGLQTIFIQRYPDYSSNTFVLNFEENQDITGKVFRLQKDKASLAGIVVNKFDKTPIRGAEVYIETSNKAITQLDGTFLLTGIDEGYQKVYVDGGDEFSKEVYTLHFEKGKLLSGVTFELEPINVYKIKGTVVDKLTGNSIENTKITISKDGATLSLHDYSDSDGTYLLSGLSVGTYIISADATNKRYDLQTYEVDIVSGQLSYIVNFQLQTNLAKIAGKVTDQDSNNLLGATVTAYLNGDKNNKVSVLTLYDGSYTFNELTGEKNYLISASKSGYLTKEVWVTTVSGQTVNNVDFSLKWGLSGISGSITDAKTGSYLNGVTVIVKDAATLALVQATNSDFQGKFSFSNLQPGRYLLYFSAENYAEDSEYVNLLTGEVLTVAKTLSTNIGSVAGTVTDKFGDPINQVKAYYGGKLAYTDDQGKYLLTGITPGIKIITFEAQGYESKGLNVNVIAGETVSLDAQLDSLYGNLAGRVVDEIDNQPLTGATVRVSGFDNSGNVFIETKNVDYLGKFLFTDLPKGEITVEVSYYPDYVKKSFSADLPSGETLDLSDIGLAKGVSDLYLTTCLYNKVTGISAELGGVTVEIYDENSNLIIKKISDFAGKVSFEGLNPDSYLVKAFKENYQTQEINVELLAGLSVETKVYLTVLFGNVIGTVEDKNNNILSGVTVMLFTSETAYLDYHSNPSTNSYRLKDKIITDGAGQYRFEKVKEGNYYVVAEKNNYLSYESQGGMSFSLIGGEDKNLPPLVLVKKYGRIMGTIVGVKDPFYFQSNPQDTTNFVPLSGITYWYAPMGTAINYNNPHYALQFGSFEVNDLEDGDYKFVAKDERFDTGEAYVKIIAGETTSQYIFCNNIYGSLGGVVQDLSGGLAGAAFVSGATVTVQSTTLPTPKTYTYVTNTQGTFVFPNIRVNDKTATPNEYKELYNIKVKADGYATEEVQEWILAGQTTQIVVNLTKNVGNLQVTVTDTNGAPLSNISVGIHSSNLTGQTVSTTYAGIALFRDLEEAHYQIIAGDGGVDYATQEVYADVVAGVTTTVQLTMKSVNGMVYGLVRSSADGSVLIGATVTITDADGNVTSVTSESDGRYRATGIQLGQLTVVADAEGYDPKSEIVELNGSSVEVNFDLEPSIQPTVTGYVKIENTNIGIQNVKVKATNIISGISYTAFTDANGQYTFTNVRYGTYHLTAEPSTNDYNIGSGNGTIDATNNTFEDIFLQPNKGTIYGFVVDSGNREGIKGISVYLTDVGSNTKIPGAEYLSDYNGYYVITGITFGRYDIHFVDDAATTAEAFAIRGESVTYQTFIQSNWEVGVGTTVEMGDILMVRAPNYGSISGIALYWYIMTDPDTNKTFEAYLPFVSNQNGHNTGITIEFYLGQIVSQPVYTTTTDPDGFFRMSNLVEGKWYVVVRWHTQEEGSTNPRYLIPYTYEVDVHSGMDSSLGEVNWYDFDK